MGPVSNLIYAYAESSIARNLMIHLITNQSFSVSSLHEVRPTEQRRLKSTQKLLHLYFHLPIKATHILFSAYKILNEILLTYQKFNTDCLE